MLGQSTVCLPQIFVIVIFHYDLESFKYSVHRNPISKKNFFSYEKVKSSNGKLVWLVIVVASLGVASIFLATAIVDFMDRSVVTTFETTTASLQVRRGRENARRKLFTTSSKN